MIVADAGPLIGLARVGMLELLHTLHGVVAVPPQVHEELQVSANRPGSRAILQAFEAGWLVTKALGSPPGSESSPRELDEGEAAAILLAEQLGSVPLLIDERRGRAAARRRRLPVLGTGGVLLAAKNLGAIESVRAALESLSEAGYRMAPALRERLLELAGER